MTGKKLIAIIIIVSLIGLILTWIFGQKVINDYDLERALETTALFSSTHFTPFS